MSMLDVMILMSRAVCRWIPRQARNPEILSVS